MVVQLDTNLAVNGPLVCVLPVLAFQWTGKPFLSFMETENRLLNAELLLQSSV